MGRLVLGGSGVAWSLATFGVAPVLVVAVVVVAALALLGVGGV